MSLFVIIIISLLVVSALNAASKSSNVNSVKRALALIDKEHIELDQDLQKRIAEPYDKKSGYTKDEWRQWIRECYLERQEYTNWRERVSLVLESDNFTVSVKEKIVEDWRSFISANLLCKQAIENAGALNSDTMESVFGSARDAREEFVETARTLGYDLEKESTELQDMISRWDPLKKLRIKLE